MREPVPAHRELLETKILRKLAEPVRHSVPLDAPLPVLVQSAKEQGFEGLVAKCLDRRCKPCLRSGAWMKIRLNREHEIVIGGHTQGTRTFDGLVFGHYEGGRLLYAGSTRNGFTPLCTPGR